MAETVSDVSDVNHKPSGASGDTEETTTQASKDSVAYETYKKVLAEKKRRDEELRLKDEELAKLKKAEKERQEAELKQKEDYKKLVELRETELNEFKSKYESLNSTIQESVKFNAFLEALPGQLPKKFWQMVDTREIVIDPSTNEPDPSSVKKIAEKFQAEYGELIQVPGKAKLPNSAASTVKNLSEEVWQAMSPKEKKENLASYVEYKKSKGR